MKLFGSTYERKLGKGLSALMKENKCPVSSRINDLRLGSDLKVITAYKISIEVEKTVAEELTNEEEDTTIVLVLLYCETLRPIGNVSALWSEGSKFGTRFH
ncbi:hypothetical protein AVEN_201437-1 [Araneus ventricosus]|uniref:Uncharacterized protein n=1 Tax=Araneus ventricosus TaxID=182803 RepID=A0A4Y2USR1_ARAVE|nr:hypothetical protein AVEN_201437-1 [Araneus ventricosus]